MFIKISDLQMQDELLINRKSDNIIQDEKFLIENGPKELSNILNNRRISANRFGISLPQFGIYYKAFSLGIDSNNIITCYDSEIIDKSDKTIVLPEFTNHFKNIPLYVKRSDTITIKYYDKNLNLIEQTYKGYTARIIQQMQDHIEGKSIKDLVSSLKWDIAKRKYKKIIF